MTHMTRMTRMTRTRRRPATAIAVWMLLGTSGCSTSRYDADYARAVEAYREAAPFAVLEQTPRSLESKVVNVSLRIPIGFLAVEDGPPAAEGGPPIKPDRSRLQPPFLIDFPGYRGTFERQLSAGGTELPISLAIGSVPAGSRTRAEIEASIAGQARSDEAFGKADLTWADRAAESVAGGPAAWRVLSLSGPQMFEGVVAGNVEFKRWEGSCEIWLSADPDEAVRTLLVWRLPQQIAEGLPMPLERLAAIVARTVKAEPVEAQADDEGSPAASGVGAGL
jgi:hypothetical protein